MSNKKGIAFYLDRKFIVYEEETTKVHSMLLDYNIEECFENIKNIETTFGKNLLERLLTTSLLNQTTTLQFAFLAEKIACCLQNACKN